MKKKEDSPNPRIDKEIARLLGQIDTDIPIDTKVKVLQMAINWEKVKHHIKDEEAGLDQDIFGGGGS